MNNSNKIRDYFLLCHELAMYWECHRRYLFLRIISWYSSSISIWISSLLQFEFMSIDSTKLWWINPATIYYLYCLLKVHLITSTETWADRKPFQLSFSLCSVDYWIFFRLPVNCIPDMVSLANSLEVMQYLQLIYLTKTVFLY